MPPTFQYCAKTVFLTYAQCPVEKDELLEMLKLKGTLSKAAIAREQHDDGNFHLHCAAWYAEPIRFTDPHHLDISGYHPNIRDKQIRSKKAVLKYISKEDADPLEFNINVQQELAMRTQHKRILGKRLMEENLPTLLKEFPELVFGYKALKADIAEAKLDLIRAEPMASELSMFGTTHVLDPAKK